MIGNVEASFEQAEWMSNRITTKRVSESDRRVLAKAKKQEEKFISKGWRWFSITPTLKILVECDAEGNPTEKGKRQIKRKQEQFC